MISSPGCVCLGDDISRVEVDAHLDDLASGGAEIVPLQVGSFGSRLLRLRHVQRQTASDDQHRYRHDSRLFSCGSALVLQTSAGEPIFSTRMKPDARRRVYWTIVV